MERYTLLALLPIITTQAFVPEYQCAIDRRSEINIHEELLQADLFSNYSSITPPKGNCSELLKVGFIFGLMKFNMIEDDMFSAAGNVRYEWTDDRLVWDPKFYDEIRSTVVSNLKVWFPSIQHNNSFHDYFSKLGEEYTLCRVNYDGKINCVSHIYIWSSCVGDAVDWPYETLVCPLIFGATADQSKIFELDFEESFLITADDNGGGWKMVQYEQAIDENYQKQLTMKITLQRRADYTKATLIWPVLVMCLLNFVSSFLDVRKPVRLYFTCFALLCQLYFPWGQGIPNATHDAPKILMLYRFSIIMNVTCLLSTYVLMMICKKRTEVPGYIENVNGYVYKRFAKIIFPRWVDEETRLVSWCDFANLLNSVFIFIFIFLHIVMFSVYVPLPKVFPKTSKIFYMDYEI